MLLPLRVYADNKHFPKNSSFFFTISFNHSNDVYVKIYETAQLTHKNYSTTLKYRCFSKSNMHESNILGLHHVETVFIYLFASTNTDKDFFGKFSFNL
jgi:hypothetical protein